MLVRHPGAFSLDSCVGAILTAMQKLPQINKQLPVNDVRNSCAFGVAYE
jgi:hypothetical protein